jgi:hypothetical protein
LDFKVVVNIGIRLKAFASKNPHSAGVFGIVDAIVIRLVQLATTTITAGGEYRDVRESRWTEKYIAS